MDAQPGGERTLSKSAFAIEVGVSPGRVSQWIAKGTIGPDALDGEGRSAKVIVDRAIAQIRTRRDVGQSLGNGLATKVTLEANPSGPTPAGHTPSPPARDDVAHQIQLERLKSERRKNERDSVDEALRQARLVPAEDVRAQMTKLARQVDEANGAMLADFATAIAGKFSLPQRDVLHLLREVRNERKGIAAKQAAEAVEGHPPTVTFVIEDEGADEDRDRPT